MEKNLKQNTYSVHHMNGVPWSYARGGRGTCESLHNEEAAAEAGGGVREIPSPPQRPGLSRQDNQGYPMYV